MANAGAKLSSFPEVNDIQTGDMFPLLSGGNTNAKIDYATLADAIIAKLKSEAGDGVLSINGKTGVVTINKSDVGLDNVDNTSDADKPISTAVQEALDDKANNSVATSSADGLMSKADKAKLDDIGTGSNVKSVNGKTGAVTLAKSDVGLSSVANLDQSKAIKSITRSGTTFTATALDGTTTTFTQQDSSTTYDIATSSADGLMSKTDKAKLDGISSGADASPIKTVKVNGTALTPDSSKAVNVTVPTLANNATTTAGGMALDARMGKTLADQASQLAQNTAQIETAGTATNAHSAGEYVMISNALYKVTAAVAKGDTWTIGTNVTAANIGSEIGSLKSDLAEVIEGEAWNLKGSFSGNNTLNISDIIDSKEILIVARMAPPGAYVTKASFHGRGIDFNENGDFLLCIGGGYFGQSYGIGALIKYMGNTKLLVLQDVYYNARLSLTDVVVYVFYR